jgi:hypothetical protein
VSAFVPVDGKKRENWMSYEDRRPRVKAEMVTELSTRYGCPRMQAKSFLVKQAAIAEIESLQESGTIEEKLDFILDRMKGQLASGHHPADDRLMEAAREMLQEKTGPTLG